MTAAGLHTVDLDKELGGTKSADRLVGSEGPPRRLVEVKGASGAAPESLLGQLERHLTTWPQLRPASRSPRCPEPSSAVWSCSTGGA
jgi:hypothetical protein